MITKLLNWLDQSTCNFLAVATIENELKNAGYVELKMEDSWKVCRGGKYYIKKNDSAIFAVNLGNGIFEENGARIISAHSDSPCFKIKPNAEIYGDGGVVSLNVEKYGGGILYTWFDRPLSISGRIMLKGEDFLHPKTVLVDLQKPVAFIPHLAIHFNREVNEGNKLSVQKDMKPVVGYFTPEQIEVYKKNGGVVKSLIASHLGIEPQDIIEYELCLYPFEKAATAGINNEYFQSARIDDLSMAYAGLEALLNSTEKSAATRVLAVFDNEETGSGTKQGAASPILKSIIRRLSDSLAEGDKNEAFYRVVANSFMVSADDAHAWHPNYNDKYDPTNHPVIGGGPVIKINANCKYMTDSVGAAVFAELCRNAGVKCQYFVNHSDVAGGSTLGNISSSQLDLNGVDMGNAIWAMHSARETAGVSDHLDTIKAFTEFYK